MDRWDKIELIVTHILTWTGLPAVIASVVIAWDIDNTSDLPIYLAIYGIIAMYVSRKLRQIRKNNH